MRHTLWVLAAVLLLVAAAVAVYLWRATPQYLGSMRVGGLGVAIRWTALDTDADPVAAGLAIMRAHSASGFVDA